MSESISEAIIDCVEPTGDGMAAHQPMPAAPAKKKSVFDRRQPCVCEACGKVEGEKVEGERVVISRGRVGRDNDGNFIPESLCKSCVGIEKDNGVEIFRHKDLLTRVEQLNSRRVESLAKREADRKKRKAECFEAAKTYWKKVGQGEAEKLPEVRKDDKGNFLCGVPDCGCREFGDKPVSRYAVIEATKAIVGLCAYQFAALKKSVGKKIFASNELFRCERHLRWLSNGGKERREGQENGGNGKKEKRGGTYRLSFRKPKVVKKSRPEASHTSPVADTKASKKARARNAKLAAAITNGTASELYEKEERRKEEARRAEEEVRAKAEKEARKAEQEAQAKKEGQKREEEIVARAKAKAKDLGFSFEEVVEAYGSAEAFLKEAEESVPEPVPEEDVEAAQIPEEVKQTSGFQEVEELNREAEAKCRAKALARRAKKKERKEKRRERD